MSKTVLLVGHCGPDGSYLRMAVHAAVPGARVMSASDQSQLEQALTRGVDLILLNRMLDGGFPAGGGVELIGRLRQCHPKTKVMLISNYADAQAAAVAAGAVPGFGKRDVGSPAAIGAIRFALE